MYLLLIHIINHQTNPKEQYIPAGCINIPHGSIQQMPPYGKSTPRSCDQEYEPMGGRTNTHLLQSSMQNKIHMSES